MDGSRKINAEMKSKMQRLVGEPLKEDKLLQYSTCAPLASANGGVDQAELHAHKANHINITSNWPAMVPQCMVKAVQEAFKGDLEFGKLMDARSLELEAKLKRGKATALKCL